MLTNEELLNTDNHSRIINTISPLTQAMYKKGLFDEGLRFVVAGGAVRDTYFNTKIKDVDLFFYDEKGKMSFEEIDDSIVYILSSAGCSYFDKSLGESPYPSDEENGFLCYGLRGDLPARNFPTDLITRKTPVTSPEEIVATFDLDICKGWYDPFTNSYSFSPEFEAMLEKGYMNIETPEEYTRYVQHLLFNVKGALSIKTLNNIDFPIKMKTRNARVYEKTRLINPSTMPKMFIE